MLKGQALIVAVEYLGGIEDVKFMKSMTVMCVLPLMQIRFEAKQAGLDGRMGGCLSFSHW